MEGGSPISGGAATGLSQRLAWIPTDIVGALALLRRYWLVLAASAVAGIVALNAAAVVSGPSYVVTAKIMVNLGPEMVGSPLLAAREGNPAAPAMRRPEDATTGVEIFTNPRLIRDVVNSLGEGFFTDPPPTTLFQQVKHIGKSAMGAVRGAVRETLVSLGLRPRTTLLDRVSVAMDDAIRIEPVRRADVITVTMSYPDPGVGEMILGRFIDLAIAEHTRAYRMPGVTEFFREGRTERRGELRRAEERLLALRMEARTPVWSVAEQRPVLIRAEADAQQALRQVAATIAAVEAEIARAEATLAGLPNEVELTSVRSRNPTTDALRSRLVELQLDLAQQQTRYGEDSREIADIRRQAGQLLALLQSEEPTRIDQVTMGVNQLHQLLERDIVTRRIDLEGQRGRARQLEQETERLRVQLRDIETAAIEIAQLEQDVVRLRRAVDLYERGYEDSRIAEAMQAVQLSGLRVVMPPTAEIIPSRPSLKRNALLGLVGGLALGFAFLLYREFRLASGGGGAPGEPEGLSPQRGGAA